MGARFVSARLSVCRCSYKCAPFSSFAHSTHTSSPCARCLIHCSEVPALYWPLRLLHSEPIFTTTVGFYKYCVDSTRPKKTLVHLIIIHYRASRQRDDEHAMRHWRTNQTLTHCGASFKKDLYTNNNNKIKNPGKTKDFDIWHICARSCSSIQCNIAKKYQNHTLFVSLRLHACMHIIISQLNTQIQNERMHFIVMRKFTIDTKNVNQPLDPVCVSVQQGLYCLSCI